MTIGPSSSDPEERRGELAAAPGDDGGSLAVSWLGLGDSYQSGAGDRDRDSGDCGRGTDAPARSAAHELRMQGWDVDLTFLACLGAHLDPADSNSELDVPAQIEEAAESGGQFDVVSLGAGGNDAGWIDVLARCWYSYVPGHGLLGRWVDTGLADPDPLDHDEEPGRLDISIPGVDLVGSPGCWALFDDWDIWEKTAARLELRHTVSFESLVLTTPEHRETLFEVFQEELFKFMGVSPTGENETGWLQQRVEATLEQIDGELGPELILVPEYPRLFAAPSAERGWSWLTDQSLVDACWGVQRPFLHAFRNGADELNDMYREAATQADVQADVQVVPVADAFEGHNLCDDDSWINGPELGSDALHERVPVPVPTVTQSFHPDHIGEQTSGALLADAAHERLLSNRVDPEARRSDDCPDSFGLIDWNDPGTVPELAGELRAATTGICEVVAWEPPGQVFEDPVSVHFGDGRAGSYYAMHGYSENEIAARMRRDVATFRLDRHLGYNRVPVTVPWYGPRVSEDHPADLGSLQDQPGGVLDPLPLSEYPEVESQQVAVLDYIVWHGFRGADVHYLTGADTELVAIANTDTFPAEVSTANGSIFARFYAGVPLDDEVLRPLGSDNLDTDDLARDLRLTGMDNAAVEGALARLETVRDEEEIPVDVWDDVPSVHDCAVGGATDGDPEADGDPQVGDDLDGILDEDVVGELEDAWERLREAIEQGLDQCSPIELAVDQHTLPLDTRWRGDVPDDWYFPVIFRGFSGRWREEMAGVHVDNHRGLWNLGVRAPVVDGTVIDWTPQGENCGNGVAIENSSRTVRYYYCMLDEVTVQPGERVQEDGRGRGAPLGHIESRSRNDGRGFDFAIRARPDRESDWGTDTYCPAPLLDALAARAAGEDAPDTVTLHPEPCEA